jgi:hypothetical protein
LWWRTTLGAALVPRVTPQMIVDRSLKSVSVRVTHGTPRRQASEGATPRRVVHARALGLTAPGTAARPSSGPAWRRRRARARARSETARSARMPGHRVPAEPAHQLRAGDEPSSSTSTRITNSCASSTSRWRAGWISRAARAFDLDHDRLVARAVPIAALERDRDEQCAEYGVHRDRTDERRIRGSCSIGTIAADLTSHHL